MNGIAPALWPGSTVAILAGGPSLTQADVDVCLGRARVIAIKNAIQLAPWADVLYACDAKWWKAWPETASFTGPKYGLERVRGREDVTVLRQAGKDGLSEDRGALATGQNSGYQAINLAVHFGAVKIVLLGFDMQPAPDGALRWHGKHRYGNTTPPFAQFLQRFRSIVEPLKRLGIMVINCSRVTALDLFPTMPLAEALA